MTTNQQVGCSSHPGRALLFLSDSLIYQRFTVSPEPSSSFRPNPEFTGAFSPFCHATGTRIAVEMLAQKGGLWDGRPLT
jgi:hypothetical protein